MLQVVSFNFESAIGEPLTELIRNLILRNVSADNAELLRVLAANSSSRTSKSPRTPRPLRAYRP